MLVASSYLAGTGEASPTSTDALSPRQPTQPGLSVLQGYPSTGLDHPSTILLHSTTTEARVIHYPRLSITQFIHLSARLAHPSPPSAVVHLIASVHVTSSTSTQRIMPKAPKQEKTAAKSKGRNAKKKTPEDSVIEGDVDAIPGKVAPEDILDAAEDDDEKVTASLDVSSTAIDDDINTSDLDPNASFDSTEFNAMLYQLVLYKARRGNMNIPQNDPQYTDLYNWVQNQRKHYKLYQDNNDASLAAALFLNSDRIAVLDAVGFHWNIRGDSSWQKNYEALVSYTKEHGDTRVPRLYTRNPTLGEWVTEQRRQWKLKMERKPSMMSDERKNKLDELVRGWLLSLLILWHRVFISCQRIFPSCRDLCGRLGIGQNGMIVMSSCWSSRRR